jgi:hypothetical protein
MNFLDALETPATLPPNRVRLAHNPCKMRTTATVMAPAKP